ncbi:MAG: oligosaccharide flippase family protein [Saprospiraceae bacterium]
MNREFAGNAVLVVVLNLLVKSFYLFGIDRTVQNVLPPEVYGLYFTLFNFAFLFQVIADFGLQNFNLRNVSRHRQLLEKYFPYLLSLKIALGLAFVTITLLVGYWWGFEQHVTPTHLLLGGIALNQVLQTGIVFLRTNLAGLGFYRLDSWFSVLDKALLVIIGSLLLWGGFQYSFTVWWLIGMHTVAYLITLLALLWQLKPHFPNGLRLRWQPALQLSLLKQSAPFAWVLVLMTAYTRMDAIMIEKLAPLGAEEAGYYAAAYRLLDASNLAGFLLAGLLLPMFSRLLKEGESIIPLTRLGISTIGAGAISLSISVWMFAEPIMTLLYKHTSEDSATMLQWLMLTFIPVGGGYVYGSLLVANDNLRSLNRVFALGLLVNLCLNIWWIPEHGAAGAAKATFITQLLVFVAQYRLAVHLLQLPSHAGLWWRMVALAAWVAGCAWGLQPWDIGWFVKFMLCISVGVGGAFALGLLM